MEAFTIPLMAFVARRKNRFFAKPYNNHTGPIPIWMGSMLQPPDPKFSGGWSISALVYWRLVDVIFFAVLLGA